VEGIAVLRELGVVERVSAFTRVDLSGPAWDRDTAAGDGAGGLGLSLGVDGGGDQDE
jgi:hypothetical protein